MRTTTRRRRRREGTRIGKGHDGPSRGGKRETASNGPNVGFMDGTSGAGAGVASSDGGSYTEDFEDDRDTEGDEDEDEDTSDSYTSSLRGDSDSDGVGPEELTVPMMMLVSRFPPSGGVASALVLSWFERDDEEKDGEGSEDEVQANASQYDAQQD